MRYFDCSDAIAMCRWVFPGEKTRFENEFAGYIGSTYAVGTSYGRTAIYLGLRAIDVFNGEVIIPAFTCTVVRQAVVMAGGIPRFVDVDPGTFDFDLDDLKKQINEKTKALILTHYFGRVARNMEQVIQLAKEKNIYVLEDCAHTLGGGYKQKKIGLYGDMAIFSLTKGMINFGGGVLVTNDGGIHQTARRILTEETNSITKRILDFPMVLAYGLEQAIDKLIFDRVGKSLFKWWLIRLPDIFLVKLRRHIIQCAKLPLSLVRGKKDGKKNNAAPAEKGPAIYHYEQGIYMEPIIASLARSQLRKMDVLIHQRKQICRQLAGFDMFHKRNPDDRDFYDTATSLAIAVTRTDMNDVVETCKNAGLLLRPTWPAHQNIWEEQDTENLKKIKESVLTWNVNPSVSKGEIDAFISILNRCNA